MKGKAPLRCAAFLAIVAPAGASPLEAVLQAREPVGSPSGEVRFWLTLRSPWEEGCTPILIDPETTAEASPPSVWPPRPHTIVTLTIKGQDGKEARPRPGYGSKATSLREHELVLLRCGESYGWEVWLSRIPWAYDLGPGRYTLRARVRIPVAAFLKNRDGLQHRIESLWDGHASRPFIRDAEVESNEIEFSVPGAN